MAHALLPDPKALALDTIACSRLVLSPSIIRTNRRNGRLPGLQTAALIEFTARYQRTLQDLPWQGNAVSLPSDSAPVLSAATLPV